MSGKDGRFETEERFWDAVIYGEPIGPAARTGDEPVRTAPLITDMGGIEVDNSGQILIYTEWFRWNDGTVRTEPDPSWVDSSEDRRET